MHSIIFLEKLMEDVASLERQFSNSFISLSLFEDF